VVAAAPQIAGLGHRRLRHRRHLIGVTIVAGIRGSEQLVEFERRKAEHV
jgi:hypothetical protein